MSRTKRTVTSNPKTVAGPESGEPVYDSCLIFKPGEGGMIWCCQVIRFWDSDARLMRGVATREQARQLLVECQRIAQEHRRAGLRVVEYVEGSELLQCDLDE